MNRGQFTFYASFALALAQIQRKTDRANAYDAICNYALFGQEPPLEKLSKEVVIAFELIRPNLDASRRKAEAGSLGGKRRPVCLQAKGKQKASKGEKENETESEIETEKENETEHECAPPAPSGVGRKEGDGHDAAAGHSAAPGGGFRGFRAKSALDDDAP